MVLVINNRDNSINHQELERTLKSIFIYDLNKIYTSIKLGLSFGISVADETLSHPGILLEQAVFALNTIPNSENGSFRYYNDNIVNDIRYSHKVEHYLESAIAKQELKILFQPIVDATFHKISSFEVLLRWDSKELGSISPNEFIPIAEQSDLIFDLERWVLEQSCKTISTQRNNQKKSIIISVNISPKHLRQDHFIEYLNKTLNKYQVKKHQIKLEITEHSTIAIDEIKKSIDACGNIKCYLDDFGTGYCSINALQQLNIAGIKIDKSFTDKILTDENTLASIRLLINMAKQCNIESIIEGVENKQQADVLKNIGGDYLQGFYFSEPKRLKLFNDYNEF